MKKTLFTLLLVAVSLTIHQRHLFQTESRVCLESENKSNRCKILGD